MMLTEFSRQFLAGPVVNHLCQSTVVTIAAWLLALILRNNHARTRYWLWMIASLKFLVPFSLLISAGEWLRSAVATPIQRPALAAVMEQIAQPFPQAQAVVAAGPQVTAHHPSIVPTLLLGAWACGSLLVAFLWFRNWLQIRIAVRTASPCALAAGVPVLSSSSLLEPGIFGVLRPVLLLPQGIMDRLTPAQLDAIVAHEMCHVRRRDNVTFTIHMVVETLFWFHPFVWWIGARLIEERELACDEAVLQSGSEAEVYAESILNVCKFYVESPLRCASGVSGADLKKRIARIMTEHVARELNLRRKLLLSAAGLLAVLVPLAFGLVHPMQSRAQSASTQSPAVPDWQTAAGGKMSFEVASVRLAKPGAFTPPNFVMDDADSFGSDHPGGRLTANFPLIVYIMFAYKLRPTGEQIDSMLAPLPKWVTTDSFVVNAKAEGNPTKDQMRLMVQSLLEDRFKLTIHFASQQVPVLALVLDKPGKTGPKLRPHAEGRPCDVSAPMPASISENVADVFPPACNIEALISRPNHALLLGSRDVTMKRIAGIFPDLGRLGRPVVDETGLSGTYDFTLEWTPEPNGSTPPEQGAQSEVQGSTFLEALKEQLGLKLKPTKGPVDVLVVDHIERPSEN